jgi:protein-tyrosine-phosphatase
MVPLTMVTLLVLGALQAPASDAGEKMVVFVCEHGAAKSVVAAAHFNRLAQERGLPFRAISRGTDPEPTVPSRVSEGLRADGAPLPEGFVPAPVQSADTVRAVRVVTFDVQLPADIQRGPVTNWSGVPAVSDGYPAASRDIRLRVNALLKELASGRP